MKKHNHKTIPTAPDSHDMDTLADDARALLAATADVAGEHVADVRKRLSAVLDKDKEMYDRVRDQAMEGVKAANVALHDHPYQAMGIALGVGALLGLLVGSQPWSRDGTRIFHSSRKSA
jgi:ElaB/YqjD/DUF883 family membrane-anchored ribosome-binding protein